MKPHRSSKDSYSNPTGTMLSEDYAEIVEEGDYSIPAGTIFIYLSSKTFLYRWCTRIVAQVKKKLVKMYSKKYFGKLYISYVVLVVLRQSMRQYRQF